MFADSASSPIGVPCQRRFCLAHLYGTAWHPADTDKMLHLQLCSVQSAVIIVRDFLQSIGSSNVPELVQLLDKKPSLVMRARSFAIFLQILHLSEKRIEFFAGSCMGTWS